MCVHVHVLDEPQVRQLRMGLFLQALIPPSFSAFLLLCLYVRVQVLDEPEVRQLRMGLFLGVAQGSTEPLKLIHLTYTPDGPVHQVVSGRCAW
jgi:hypothetical protein